MMILNCATIVFSVSFLLVSTDQRYASTNQFVGHETKALKKGDARPDRLPNGQFRVYGMRFCPYTERVLIYLAKKNITAHVVNINLKQKPDWFKNVHPDAKVPALEHNGKAIVESSIIVQYLDDLFPNTTILPKDPYKRAQQRLLFKKASIFTDPLVDFLHSTPKNREELHEHLENDLIMVESLLKNKFFGGEHPGYTDYLMFPVYERLAVFAEHSKAHEYNVTTLVGAKRFPHLTQWYRQMSLLPEVAITRPKRSQLLEFFDGYIEGHPNPDVGLD